MTGVLFSKIGLAMAPYDWRGDRSMWLGPKRGNLGSKGNREAQRKREAEKRKIARAKARAARDAAGEVVNKRERIPTKSFENTAPRREAEAA